MGFRAGRFEEVESDTFEGKKKKNRDRVGPFIREDLIGVRILPFGSLPLSLAYRYSSVDWGILRSSSRPITCCTRVCLRDL